MFRTFLSTLAILALVAVYSNGVLAVENGHDMHKSMKHAASSTDGGVYTLLVDPLGDSLVNVAKPILMVHDGRQLLFASQKNAETFMKNSDKYLADVDALIIKQQGPQYPLTTCVVSGESLNMMGNPIQRVMGNRLVKFCCPGCIGKFKKNPAQYLAKIDAAVIAAQTKDYPLAICFISGEKLGGDMGGPVEYVAGTQLLKFCCKGCVKKFKKNPAKYLIKFNSLAKGHDESKGHNEAKGHQEYNNKN